MTHPIVTVTQDGLAVCARSWHQFVVWQGASGGTDGRTVPQIGQERRYGKKSKKIRVSPSGSLQFIGVCVHGPKGTITVLQNSRE